MRYLVWLAAIGGVFLAIACEQSGPMEPDPKDFEVPAVRYQCGGWYEGARPEVERGLFDVFFYSRPEDVPPSQEQCAEVRDAGGLVVHEFNAPIIRAIISVDSLENLVHTNRAAWGVPDEGSYLVRLNAMMRSLITEEKRDYLSSHGVVIDGETTIGSRTAMAFYVPDSQLPEIWGWEEWSSIGIASWACSAR